MRLGWTVGPADVSAQLVSAKQNTDRCAGALGQRLFESTFAVAGSTSSWRSRDR